MVEILETEVNKFVIKQVFGRRRDGEPVILLPSSFSRVFGKEWDGEMIVSSNGQYIYNCPSCKTSIVGNLKDTLESQNRMIMCYCQRGFDADIFAGDGPRMYVIRKEPD